MILIKGVMVGVDAVAYASVNVCCGCARGMVKFMVHMYCIRRADIVRTAYPTGCVV